MAIRTQQTQIALIRGPVFEPVGPRIVPIFPANFLSRVHMVYVESAMIGESAFGAFATEFRDKRKFAFPETCPFMRSVSMGIPVLLLAIRRAKTGRGCLAASFTFSRISPAVCEITSLAAKLAASIFQPVRMHGCRLFAMFADDLNWFLSHV